MTQKEAIEKALEKLGGRATLQEIYPLAIGMGHFSGSKDKKATIRNYLQTSPKNFRRSPGKPDGWYELISYQENIACRDRRIAELEALLSARDKELVILPFLFFAFVFNVAQPEEKEAPPPGGVLQWRRGGW